MLLPGVIISTVNEGLNKWVYVHEIYGPKNVQFCTHSEHWIYKLQVFTEIIVSMVNKINNNKLSYMDGKIMSSVHFQNRIYKLHAFTQIICLNSQ